MQYETLTRFAVFASLFLLLALLERLVPRRPRAQPRAGRWATNFGLVLIDGLTLRLLAVALPLLATGAALDAAANDWGLLNWTDLPAAIEICIAILVLDFVIWTQHLLTHKVPPLWQLHQVHHADVDVDVTSAIRFHPIEIALSMLLKIGTVYVLGPSVVAVIIFEILLNSTAMFNHSNIRLPNRLDAVLRNFLVTPDMHRVHHSVHRDEHDSNYGFSLSLWDRAFGTYTAQPRDGHQDMRTGLHWQDRRPSQLGWSLLMPFRRNP